MRIGCQSVAATRQGNNVVASCSNAFTSYLCISTAQIIALNKMSLIQLFLLCLCASSLFAADKYVVRNIGKRNSVKYCGKNLVHALQIVCNGVYQHMFYKKSATNRDDWYDTDLENEFPDYRFKPKTSAIGIIKQALRRRRRGITDECCRVGCNIAELSNYCGGYD